MIRRILIILGLLCVLAAMLPELIASTGLLDAEAAAVAAPFLMQSGAVMLAIGLLAWLVEKVVARVPAARCRDCRKPVQRGHAYCFDHLMQHTNAARARHHGKRGLGV